MTLARPLLTTSRAELREALRDAGEGWREDATNSEAFCLRNRLRLELLGVSVYRKVLVQPVSAALLKLGVTRRQDLGRFMLQ